MTHFQVIRPTQAGSFFLFNQLQFSQSEKLETFYTLNTYLLFGALGGASAAGRNLLEKKTTGWIIHP